MRRFRMRARLEIGTPDVGTLNVEDNGRGERGVERYTPCGDGKCAEWIEKKRDTGDRRGREEGRSEVGPPHPPVVTERARR